jgi:hypothetical protein
VSTNTTLSDEYLACATEAINIQATYFSERVEAENEAEVLARMRQHQLWSEFEALDAELMKANADNMTLATFAKKCHQLVSLFKRIVTSAVNAPVDDVCLPSLRNWTSK